MAIPMKLRIRPAVFGTVHARSKSCGNCSGKAAMWPAKPKTHWKFLLFCFLFVCIAPGARAGLDGDSLVNFHDFAEFGKEWVNKELPSTADLDGNGVIDFNDLAVLAGNWLTEEDAGEGDKPGLAKYYTPFHNTIEPNCPGYDLPLDLMSDITNYVQVAPYFPQIIGSSLLEQNGFAVIEYDFGSPDPNRDDVVKPYAYLKGCNVPIFVTSDTLLHLYHIQFDETLKDIEEREFCGDIKDLTEALLADALTMYDDFTGDLQEAAKRNIAYLAVALKLIDPTAEVPPLVADLVAGELQKIEAHEGFDASDIFIYHEDYSQYVPRGHYTRSEQLKKYFKTLMWYGRIAFLLKGSEPWGPTGEALISTYDAKIQTMQAVLLAESIEAVQFGERTGKQIWDRLYAVTAFYVGLADDLTPCEYLGAVDKVFGGDFVPTDLLDEDDFFQLKAELTLLRSPQIYGGTGEIYLQPPFSPEQLDEVLDKTKGMRFMGQRFIPDSYMFQHLVFPAVQGYTGGEPIPFTWGFNGASFSRVVPRGLDVMTVLGSELAEMILGQAGDTDYVEYDERLNELKEEFAEFDIHDWNRNLYWGWLYSLQSLLEEPGQGYPNFVRTEAWGKKQLNAALASWTELRHDTILYAKQSNTAGGTGMPPPPPPGYVEPVPEFFGRLLALTQMTREGLSDLDALSTEAEQRLVSLENILVRLIELAGKELTCQELTEADRLYLSDFAGTLEAVVLGVDKQGVSTRLVADVHTHGVEGIVLEEGVGHVDLIVVACPGPDGSVFLAAGPVLSYYEFKHPMDDRLTDEAWRQLLDSADRPDRPEWYEPLMP